MISQSGTASENDVADLTHMTAPWAHRNRFLVLGRAGLDLYADPPGSRVEDAARFTSALGGSAANIAVAIARLGGVASLISAVSDDAVGRYTVNQLKHYGVGTGDVRAAGGEFRNSLAVVETRAENCQSVIYRNGAADFQISEDQVHAAAIKDFGALIVTGTALAADPSRSAALLAMTIARESGVRVILDIDYRPYSWASAADAARTCTRAAALSDIVIGNDTEFAVMAGPGGDGLALARRTGNAVYKMGERGSIAFAGGLAIETGIYRVTALKPTGAGDAFMGGYVTGLAQGFDLKTCILRGTAAAAIVVTGVGCAPAMPSEAELQDFMASHPGPA